MGFIILAGIVIYCLIHSEAIYEASERMRQEAEAENIKSKVKLAKALAHYNSIKRSKQTLLNAVLIVLISLLL